MKRIISSIVLCGLSVCSWAQSAMSPGESFSSTSEPIDRIRYEILYDLRQVYDRTPGNNKSISERMLLQVGDSSSAFFSYLAFQVDSVIFAMSDKEGSFEINAIPKVSWQYYKNYPTVGKSMFLDKVAMSGFAVEEQMNTPDWTLIADSSKAILGYDCRLAVANFKVERGMLGMRRTFPLIMGRGSCRDFRDWYSPPTIQTMNSCSRLWD